LLGWVAVPLALTATDSDDGRVRGFMAGVIWVAAETVWVWMAAFAG
jgi:hypothetical protein